MNVSDSTGNLWMDAFNESAAVVVGIEAQKLGEMREKVRRKMMRGRRGREREEDNTSAVTSCPFLFLLLIAIQE